MDAAARRLRPVYVTGRRTGLSEEAREEFADRLADAVGATAAGEAAERAWLRNANRACGTPWLRLWRWYHDRREPATGRLSLRAQADEEATARQRVEQAVRTVSDHASAGLPTPWALAMREAAVRGAHGLPEALDELAARTGLPPGRPPRPGWWPVAVLAQASMTLLQVLGGLWLLGQIVGFMSPNLGVPVLMMPGARPAATATRRNACCGRRPPGAAGPGCWIRWRRNCCATARCGSSTGASPGWGRGPRPGECGGGWGPLRGGRRGRR